MSTNTAAAPARQRGPRPRPVCGVCRWVRRIAWPDPGILAINGVEHAVYPLAGDLSGPNIPPVGYHLVHRPSGRWCDVSAALDACTCDDFARRRAVRDPKGCEHCAALRAALAS
jgi:hypothetical protein